MGQEDPLDILTYKIKDPFRHPNTRTPFESSRSNNLSSEGLSFSFMTDMTDGIRDFVKRKGINVPVDGKRVRT